MIFNATRARSKGDVIEHKKCFICTFYPNKPEANGDCEIFVQLHLSSIFFCFYWFLNVGRNALELNTYKFINFWISKQVLWVTYAYMQSTRFNKLIGRLWFDATHWINLMNLLARFISSEYFISFPSLPIKYIWQQWFRFVVLGFVPYCSWIKISFRRLACATLCILFSIKKKSKENVGGLVKISDRRSNGNRENEINVQFFAPPISYAATVIPATLQYVLREIAIICMNSIAHYLRIFLLHTHLF